MPTIFKIGRYVVYFWTNEGEPREPVHVHIAVGRPVSNATKLWITSNGKVLICNNNSMIPEKGLRRLIDDIEKDADVIIEAWRKYFGEVKYFC
ncbi:MAG: DUF4160 domain-containing protein [Synergistaceae bacterium]|nr:DUF4160 domain-containing protein [Synergistaceae bacterium]MBR0247345.1 DUF4160 domain-containing protein [Synergistaceae bacterium]